MLPSRIHMTLNKGQAISINIQDLNQMSSEMPKGMPKFKFSSQ